MHFKSYGKASVKIPVLHSSSEKSLLKFVLTSFL